VTSSRRTVPMRSSRALLYRWMFSSFFASQYKMVDCEGKNNQKEWLVFGIVVRKAPSDSNVDEEALT